MDRLDRFLSTYERRREELDQLQDAICNLLDRLSPPDWLEKVLASSGRLYCYSLEAVETPHPLRGNEAPTLTVRPVLEFSGDEAEEEVPKLACLDVYGRGAAGDEAIIGRYIMGDFMDVCDTGPPCAFLPDPLEDGRLEQAAWESADVEILLKLALAALQAQPSQP